MPLTAVTKNTFPFEFLPEYLELIIADQFDISIPRRRRIVVA